LRINNNFAPDLEKSKFCQYENTGKRILNYNPMNKKSAYQSSILMLLVYIISSFTLLSASANSLSNDIKSDDDMRWKVNNLGVNIEFKYTPEVKAYIKRYTKAGRNSSQGILGKIPVYFPVFEKALKEKNLPEELKILAIVESHLNVNAYSKAGAAGLWQFIKGTARHYNLKVRSNYDQRYSVEESTNAALDFLNDLHNEFDDWTLALAAYNCGAGNVRKAIRRSGGYKDFWKIQRYLPKETRNYIPKFIAISYMLKHYREYNISPIIPNKMYFSTAEARVYKHLSFKKISDITGLPMEIIKNMNSAYRRNYIPVNSQGYKLVLPKNAMFALQDFEGYDKIKYITEKNFNYSKYIVDKFSREVAINLLGEKYKFKVSTVAPLSLNLIINKNSISRKFSPKFSIQNTPKQISNEFIYYSLKPGESIMDVAMNFNNVNMVDIMRWNNIGLRHPPKAGTKLLIKK